MKSHEDNNAGIIFDGDDTLWETSVFYNEAKASFFNEMSSLGFDIEEVKPTFEKTDIANIKKLGFTKLRFPTSMADTYVYFCKKYGIDNKSEISRKFEALGKSVFERKPIILDQAEFVLKKAKSQYKLILATKGDLEIQQLKITHSGLAKHFNKIYILDDKTKKEFSQILRENNLENAKTWSVGNSLKSDIKPALQLGMKAIWIPHNETWNYEHETIPTSYSFFQVNSLGQILEILK